MKPSSFKLLGLSIILLSFVIGWQLYGMQTFLNTPLQVGKEGRTIVVASGISVKALSKELGQKQILSTPRFLSWRARWRGVSHRIKAGEYFIPSGTHPDQFLDMLIQGRVKQYSFTIVEGWTFRHLREEMEKDKILTHTITKKSDAQVMEAIGYKGVDPEGRFLPETYRFPRGTTDKEFLKRAYRAMEKTLAREWDERKENLPLKNSYDALILASIIEKETAIADEYNKISGVFIRRLQKGMRLQTDPTVIYGMGDKYDGNLRLRDLRQDTPYNTYTRKGLPPTPIALPGKEAIRAALHPDDGTALYFVAKGNGEHYFSSTLHEHNQAVIRYQLGGKYKPFSSSPARKQN